MEITVVIQYILQAAQLLGSQDYYRKVSNDDTWAYWCEQSRHRQNGLLYVPKKILTWMLREARGGLKAIVGNIVTTQQSLYPHRFLFFSVSFSQSLVFPSRLY